MAVTATRTRARYGYLSGYHTARPMDEQIAILRQYDWDRNVEWALNAIQQEMLTKPVPEGSEGYFVVVFDQTMVMHYEENPNIDQSGPIILAFNALSEQRGGHLKNYCENGFGLEHYRRSKESTEKMRELWEYQGCPTGIILIPAQFGIFHREKSVLSAPMILMDNEFPLDVYEVTQMLLTHENRLADYNDLWIHIVGAECLPATNSAFDSDTLSFQFFGRIDAYLQLSYSDTDIESGRYGSVSGFLPQ